MFACTHEGSGRMNPLFRIWKVIVPIVPPVT
jgi:hypothetical protein